MNELIIKLVLGQDYNQTDIHNVLYDICESVHAGCDSECPVYELQNENEREANSCPCFKSGEAMANFIREHKK